MYYRQIDDWTDAYTNGAHIPGGERWPAAWVEPAEAFRDEMSAAGRAKLGIAYDDRPRNAYDLFLPEGEARGLVVFVHGGYWLRFDRSFWSHFARGPNAHGYAVAMPSYTLCPEVHIRDIVAEVGAAVAHAAGRVVGPVILTGHSAGGQLVTRLACENGPLPEAVAARMTHVLSISGVHDLRPLMKTAMNADLQLDAAEAAAESPALLAPRPGTRLTCWVGAAERGEFLRQNALLANVWTGLGAATAVVEEADRHHFNVVDGLADPDSAIVRTLLGR